LKSADNPVPQVQARHFEDDERSLRVRLAVGRAIFAMGLATIAAMTYAVFSSI